MRRLVFAIDALPALREAAGELAVDLPAAATLAELAGVDAVRLAVGEDLRPVSERDVQGVRRAARRFELMMPPSPELVKLALEARPDRVVLASGESGGAPPSGPLDPARPGAAVAPAVRALLEAGIPVVARVAPHLDAVRRAHAEGLAGVELFTGQLADLPAEERAAAWESLGDASRLASKLRLELGVGGGLDFRTLPELLAAVPAVQGVAVGRAAVARAVLVGIDRALRDLRALAR